MQRFYIKGYHDAVTNKTLPDIYCFQCEGKNFLLHNGYSILLDQELTETLIKQSAEPDLILMFLKTRYLMSFLYSERRFFILTLSKMSFVRKKTSLWLICVIYVRSIK